MDDLAIKDVEFNGAVLKAVQNEIGKIFVGVRWICNGLGLSEGQMKSERKRIQEDLVLKQGGRNFILPTESGKQEAVCLNIEFLPIWLAKISITPKMKKDNPELVEKLIEYQLRAKDVLAKAFLPKEVVNQTSIVPPNNVQTIQLTLPDMSVRFDEMNYRIDLLYKDMKKFVNVMIDWKDQTKSNVPLIDDTILTYKTIIDNMPNTTEGCSQWKASAYSLMDSLIKIDKRFTNRGQVMTYLYKYMNKNYGIVWEQEIVDYMRVNSSDMKPSTIDIVYNNETYRSIFNSVLIDLIGNTDAIRVSRKDNVTLEDIILPLVDKYNDTSPHYVATYRKVYKVMTNKYNISWKNHITRSIKNGVSNPTKKSIIEGKPKLRKQFEQTVNELLEQ